MCSTHRSISPWVSSQTAYFTQLPTSSGRERMLSSKSWRPKGAMASAGHTRVSVCVCARLGRPGETAGRCAHLPPLQAKLGGLLGVGDILLRDLPIRGRRGRGGDEAGDEVRPAVERGHRGEKQTYGRDVFDLPLGGLAQQLLGRELHGRGVLVLHLRVGEWCVCVWRVSERG